MSGLLLLAIDSDTEGVDVSKDYADKPPSRWTSTSRCIQRYGPMTRWGVTPIPLAWLVRPSLPGVIDCLVTLHFTLPA